jgi:hypothetical protein
VREVELDRVIAVPFGPVQAEIGTDEAVLTGTTSPFVGVAEHHEDAVDEDDQLASGA